jgi:hypothetical protein
MLAAVGSEELKREKNYNNYHKKSPIVNIWQQGTNVGGIGLEPTTSDAPKKNNNPLLYLHELLKQTLKTDALNRRRKKCLLVKYSILVT